MRALGVLLVALASGCPRFEGEGYACGPGGACGDGLVCTSAGACCAPARCGDACGVITTACGAAVDCGACDGAVYVDDDAPTGGDGSRARPFDTITEAVALADERDRLAGTLVPTTIRVAPGLYSGGENLPIRLRGRRALVGAGRGLTRIRGAADTGVAANRILRLSGLVIGDVDGPLVVSDLTVEAAVPGGVGIICNRGNGAAVLASPPPPSVTLERVELLGADIGVLVGSGVSTGFPPCNLLVRDSYFRGMRVGIWVAPYCRHAERWSSLVVRDVEMRGLSSPEADAHGVLLYDCVRSVDIEGLHVHASEIGLSAVQHGPDDELSPWAPLELRIRRSVFERLAKHGLLLSRMASVIELEGNVFREIRSSTLAAAAIRLLPDIPADRQRASERYPRILGARRNLIAYNDRGILHHSAARFDRGSDWGTAEDPGHNELRCNHRGARLGGDLLIEAAPTGTIAIAAVGNVWDRVPPARSSSLSVDGLDVLAPDALAIDLGAARSSTAACEAP